MDARGQRAVDIGGPGRQLNVDLHLYNDDLFRKARFGTLMEEAFEALKSGGRVDAICSMGEHWYAKACAVTAGKPYLVVSADLQWVNIVKGQQLNSSDNGLLIVPQLSLVRTLPDIINRFRTKAPHRMQVRSIMAIVGDDNIDISDLYDLGVSRVLALTDVSYVRKALSAL